jgi:hypothetical protein
MMGQFYLFFTDTVYMLVLTLAVLPGTDSISYDTKDIAYIKPIEFGILSVIHCLLIPELRNKCFIWMVNTFNFIKSKKICRRHDN